MPKNIQTTIQLHSFHAHKVMLKIFQARFNSTWIENLQICKQDLEKLEESDFILPMSFGL